MKPGIINAKNAENLRILKSLNPTIIATKTNPLVTVTNVTFFLASFLIVSFKKQSWIMKKTAIETAQAPEGLDLHLKQTPLKVTGPGPHSASTAHAPPSETTLQQGTTLHHPTLGPKKGERENGRMKKKGDGEKSRKKKRKEKGGKKNTKKGDSVKKKKKEKEKRKENKKEIKKEKVSVNENASETVRETARETANETVNTSDLNEKSTKSAKEMAFTNPRMMNGFEKHVKKKLGVIANRATTTTSHINYKNKNKNIYNINSSHRNEGEYNNAPHSDRWKNPPPHTGWNGKPHSIGFYWPLELVASECTP
jgi:hypothetical protein